jgi:hypothetical protein
MNDVQRLEFRRLTKSMKGVLRRAAECPGAGVPPYLVHSVRTLEQRGFISIASNREEACGIAVTLTAAGREAVTLLAAKKRSAS